MPEICDIVIVESGAGGRMAVFMLTQAGASVAVMEVCPGADQSRAASSAE